MTTGLVRYGNHVDLIIAKVMLELVDLMMDTPLEMTADGIHIVISPRRTEEEDLLNASLNRINDRFGVTFSRFGAKKNGIVRSDAIRVSGHLAPRVASTRISSR